MVKFPTAALLLTLLASGCASLPDDTERSSKDPWESYNRSVHAFNDAVDKVVLRPVASGYRAVTPDPVERGVSNFFDNLTYPVVILNQFLQGDFGDGARDTGRFLFNTVYGLGGIFDPASTVGLERNNEDFGQTLAVWGVPAGPYFVLPFLGPSTVRDSIGTYADSEASPMFNYIGSPEKYYLLGLRIVDLRAQLLDVDSQLQSAYDPYAFMRDAFLQRREYLVHDGQLPLDQDYYEDLYDFEEFDESLPEDDAGADSASSSLPAEVETQDVPENGGDNNDVSDQSERDPASESLPGR